MPSFLFFKLSNILVYNTSKKRATCKFGEKAENMGNFVG